jgi:hypothetical protein
MLKSPSSGSPSTATATAFQTSATGTTKTAGTGTLDTRVADHWASLETKPAGTSPLSDPLKVHVDDSANTNRSVAGLVANIRTALRATDVSPIPAELSSRMSEVVNNLQLFADVRQPHCEERAAVLAMCLKTLEADRMQFHPQWHSWIREVAAFSLACYSDKEAADAPWSELQKPDWLREQRQALCDPTVNVGVTFVCGNQVPGSL